MISKKTMRSLVVIAALLLGAFAGFNIGYDLQLHSLQLKGQGNSHSDLFEVVMAGILGLLLGVSVLPVCAWLVMRRWRK